MKRSIILTLTGWLLISGLSPLSAQGTAFSYHGRLNDEGIPANGSYDFVFTPEKVTLYTDDFAKRLAAQKD